MKLQELTQWNDIRDVNLATVAAANEIEYSCLGVRCFCLKRGA